MKTHFSPKRRFAAISAACLLVAVFGCSDDKGEKTPHGNASDSDVGQNSDGDPIRETTNGGIQGSSTCKRGVAYGHHSQADFAALHGKIGWWYNWAYRPDEALRDSFESSGVEYVPMVWGGDFDEAKIMTDMPPSATTLLGFNEPNFKEQANLSAQQAAALWPRVENIATQRALKLVSPAVNFCGGACQETDPFKYLDEFFAACEGCQVDAVAMHIYVGCNQSGENKAEWLINHVETYKSRFSQPLWLTEFACTDAANFDEQRAFMRDAVAYLETEPRIERYAWFSGRFEGIPYVDLFANDGELTPLGEEFVAAPTGAECLR